MSLKRILIANRGEIAIRISRAIADLGLKSVGVYSEDDAQSLHGRSVDHAVPLVGRGPMPYIDAQQLVRIAMDHGADAIHSGYGFLAESAGFARRCAEAGIIFVGPTPEVLKLFGDKSAARAAAKQNGVPVLNGTDKPTSLDEAIGFF